jgi:hypothetical protein
MELARTEAKFFGLANLPLVEIPHHPSGGARAGEHRADAEGALEAVRQTLTVGAPTLILPRKGGGKDDGMSGAT